MAEIDDLLANMAKRGVQRVLMVGGQPMRIYSQAGEAQGATVAAPKLQSLVREILPVELRPRLLQEGRYQFPHATDSGSFEVRVERRAALLQVEVALKSAAEPAISLPQTAPKPGAAANPRDWSPRALPAFASHSQAVTSVAIAPNSQVVASAGADGAVSLWSIEQKARLLTLRPSLNSVSLDVQAPAVSFSRDGQLIAAIGAGWVQVWDVARGSSQFRESTPGQSDGCVAFSPEGSLAFGRGARAEVWDIAKKKPLRAYALQSQAQALAFSHDGRWLAVGDAHSVSLADLNARQNTLSSLQKSLARGDKSSQFTYSTEMGAPVTSLSFSPRGSGLALSAGGSCALLDSATQRVLWKQSRQDVRAVAFAPGGTAIAAATEDGIVHFFDWASGASCHAPLQVSAAPVSALAFSPDGRVLACGSADGKLSAWAMF